jgi:hypothetical protein
MTLVESSAVLAAAEEVVAENGGKWPWRLIGVMPTREDVDRVGKEVAGGYRYSFVYTVGLTPIYDVWMPLASVEGWRLDPEFAAMVMNWLAAGLTKSVISYGDDVQIPLGVPDGDDVTGVFWMGYPMFDEKNERQVNVSDADLVVSVLWSSPLGWRPWQRKPGWAPD